MKTDPHKNAFVDPKGYRYFVSSSRADFEKALAAEHAKAR